MIKSKIKKRHKRGYVDIHSEEVENDIGELIGVFDKFSSKYGNSIGGFTILKFKDFCWKMSITMSGGGLQ